MVRVLSLNLFAVIVHLACTGVGMAKTTKEASEADAVAATLNDFHLAASQADADRYFGHFAANGVFHGTDASERWTVDEFKAYAVPYFSKGQGWTYKAKERHIDFSADGQVAWFDELLDNASFGTCRGTGVLIRQGEKWLITQYHLTIPVPNPLAKRLVEMIRKGA